MENLNLAEMSIKELREFNHNPALFHKVKHTTAFAVLITRLEQAMKESAGNEQAYNFARSEADNWEGNYRSLKQRLVKVLKESAGGFST